jgi:hypothetical protein
VPHFCLAFSARMLLLEGENVLPVVLHPDHKPTVLVRFGHQSVGTSADVSIRKAAAWTTRITTLALLPSVVSSSATSITLITAIEMSKTIKSRLKFNVASRAARPSDTISTALHDSRDNTAMVLKTRARSPTTNDPFRVTRVHPLIPEVFSSPAKRIWDVGATGRDHQSRSSRSSRPAWTLAFTPILGMIRAYGYWQN